MRLALTAIALISLAACGGEPDAAGPERKNAAGEVLGGEVTDDMLPLDTVQSTSPSDPRAGAPDQTNDDAEPAAAVNPDPASLPLPQASGRPERRPPADPEPADVPPEE